MQSLNAVAAVSNANKFPGPSCPARSARSISVALRVRGVAQSRIAPPGEHSQPALELGQLAGGILNGDREAAAMLRSAVRYTPARDIGMDAGLTLRAAGVEAVTPLQDSKVNASPALRARSDASARHRDPHSGLSLTLRAGRRLRRLVPSDDFKQDFMHGGL